MTATRTETDSFGPLEVPADKYWGAQTQRSIQNFPIGWEKATGAIVRALGVVKRRLRHGEHGAGRSRASAATIVAAAQEVIDGRFDDTFRCVVWQTGSGTQSNMNVNEVISNRAIEMLGGVRGSKSPSTPTTTSTWASPRTTPSRRRCTSPPACGTRCADAGLAKLLAALDAKAEEFATSSRSAAPIPGRDTPDARPGDSAARRLRWHGEDGRRRHAADDLRTRARRTAVGTGLNTNPSFAEQVARRHRRAVTGLPFVTAPNKFEALAAHDAMVMSRARSGRSRRSLLKVANDVRFLGSGPRSGLGELILPENEPGFVDHARARSTRPRPRR